MNLTEFRRRAELAAEEWIDRVLSALNSDASLPSQRSLQVSELEERILMSAAPVAVVAVEAQPLDPQAPATSPTIDSSASQTTTKIGRAHV